MLTINLTPHAIVLRDDSGRDVTIPPSGRLARVETIEEPAGFFGIAGDVMMPCVVRRLGAVTVPPEAGDYAVLIVSSMVLEAARDQHHPLLDRMVAPDTGPTAIRERGQVVAVTRIIVGGHTPILPPIED